MKPAITTIQKLAKAGKIISRIIFVLSIVATCLIVFGLVFYLVIGDRSLIVNGLPLEGLILQETGQMIPRPILITALCLAAFACIAEVILSQMAASYFRRELADGTPFTFRGARELKRVGLWAVFLPLGVALISAIILAVVAASTTGIDSVNVRFSIESSSIGTGIFLLVVSVFCRHGAETQQAQYQQGQPYGGQYQQDPQWTPNPQWTQQQANQQWANQQAQASQQWANQQAQASQQWANQQNAGEQGTADQFRQE